MFISNEENRIIHLCIHSVSIYDMVPYIIGQLSYPMKKQRDKRATLIQATVEGGKLFERHCFRLCGWMKAYHITQNVNGAGLQSI
jgi:hypothetical protein